MYTSGTSISTLISANQKLCLPGQNKNSPTHHHRSPPASAGASNCNAQDSLRPRRGSWRQAEMAGRGEIGRHPGRPGLQFIYGMIYGVAIGPLGPAFVMALSLARRDC